MHIELIIHTADAGALQLLREAAERLRARSHIVRGRVTFEPGDAERFAREATADGADLILAAGGDGTLNEVVNGMLGGGGDGARAGAAEIPQLGIVPLGTANDFAGWLEMPITVPEAIESALDGESRVIDLARLNDRYFANVSTGGFGAEATDEAPEKVKRAVGTLAYVVTGVRKFAALQPSSARFVADGEVIHSGDFLLFAVGNGCRTGGGNFLTPRADIHDGLIDVTIVRAIGHAEFLRLMPNLRSGSHVESEHVIYRQVRELQVVPLGPLSVNVDGEPMEAETLQYSVVPGAIRLAAPRICD